MNLDVVILAAGQGKRMHSQLPKALHCLAGMPLLQHVVATAEKVSSGKLPIVVYSKQTNEIPAPLSDLKVQWALQKQPHGTGHALQQALPYITADNVLVLYGDVPLISSTTLKNFITATPENALGIITAQIPNPKGMGRILRDEHHQICSIIEEKEATDIQRKNKEVNTGIYLFPTKYLKKWLSALKDSNNQAEFYLTDVISMAIAQGVAVVGFQAKAWRETLGVNDHKDLAQIERYYQKKYANKLMRQGVTLLDPARFDVRGNLQVGQDVIIDVNVIIEGDVRIGDHCKIGANTILKNTAIGANVEIKSNSVIEGATIAENCIIGPFARIRPNTVLGTHMHIGNYVEIKNSHIGHHTKINHLSYIGDSKIGSHVNIGAGTITCNYDGCNKNQTIIEDNVFIGSNSQLIAPVTIGEGATIGAGSTITRDAPPNKLTLARSDQVTLSDWKKPKKRTPPNE